MQPSIRVLELRSAEGAGGGPEKTILYGASTHSDRYQVTVCYIRFSELPLTAIAECARQLGVRYIELQQKGRLDLRLWRDLRRIVDELRIDLVHAHDYKTNFLAQVLSRQAGITPLSTAHGWSGHHCRERLLYYPADKLLLRRFPLVIAVCSEIAATLAASRVSSERIRTILNGVDSDQFRPDPARRTATRQSLGIDNGKLVIGAVGRLEKEKRYDLLIDAFAQLRRFHPETRLVIAGDGSQRRKLQHQIERRGLGGHCQLLGHVTDIVRLYDALDLFVQSSDNEGAPNVVLEAMAMEVPVVATDTGGTRDLVDHGVHGLLVTPGNSTKLGEAIHSALTDRDAARIRVKKARTRVERDLSFESRTRRLEEIYDFLVGCRRSEAVAASVQHVG